MKPQRNPGNTWAWIYGDECRFLWDHFGIEPGHEDDRLKIKLLDYESVEEQKERTHEN